MSELQKTSHLDRHQCAMLLKTFENVLVDEALSMNNVEIEGFGQFEARKHPEYVHENSATGEVVLYPPRITYRFRADERILQ